MQEGRSYRTPAALWRWYLLHLFIIVLLLDILTLLFFVHLVLANTGNSVPAVFLWPGSIIVSLHVSFSLPWFGPEMIEHDYVNRIIDIVVSGTGDANQVWSRHYAVDINYDMVGLVQTESFAGDSKWFIGRQTITLVYKLQLPQKNNAFHS
jgi:hypothetical protein